MSRTSIRPYAGAAAVAVGWAVALAAPAAAPPAKPAATNPPAAPASRPAGPRALPVPANQPFVHEASGFRFPLNVGSFRRARVFAVDDVGRDVAVGYADPALKIVLTAHVYPAHGVAADAHFAQVKGDVTRGKASAKLLDEGPVTAGKAPKAHDGARARYAHVGELAGVQQDVVAEAYLFAHGTNFLKLRVTYPAADRKAAGPRVQTFLDELAFPPAPATRPAG